MIKFLSIEVEWRALMISIISFITVMFRDYINPWLFSPKIVLKKENEIYKVKTLTESRYLKLVIINKNNIFTSTAKNCYVKLNSIKKDGKSILPFTPIFLSWSGHDRFNDSYTTVPINRKYNLSKGEHSFIDLCYESEHGKRILYFSVSVPEKLIEELGPGKYILGIGIYGDNFKSKFKKIKAEFTDKYGGLKFI